MQINVSQLLQESTGATRDYQINEIIDITSDNQNRPVNGECHLLRTQRSILVKCSFSTDMDLACSRCLNSFKHTLKLNFEEEYFPTVDVVTGAAMPLPEDAGNFTIDAHHVIDLTEATRQYTLLSIPMKPLCSSQCAGLCQKCGHNLNEGPCDCPKQEIDPRWSELTKLL